MKEGPISSTIVPMECCPIFSEESLPNHLLEYESKLKSIDETEIPGRDYFLHYKNSILSLCCLVEGEILSLALDYDHALRMLDRQNLSYARDPLKKIFKSKKDLESPIVEIGTGAAKDTMHFLALGFKVKSFERNLPIHLINLDAKMRGLDPRCLRLELLHGEYQREDVKSHWVYFDPMFIHEKNRSAKSSKSMQIFAKLLKDERAEVDFKKLFEQDFYKLILKRSNKQKAFAAVNYSVLGKSVCYDVFTK